MVKASWNDKETHLTLPSYSSVNKFSQSCAASNNRKMGHPSMTGSPNSGCGIANMSLKTRECRDRIPRCTRNCVVCAWIITFPSSSQIRVDRVAPLAVLGGSSRIVVLFRLAFGREVGCDSDITFRKQSRMMKKERFEFERFKETTLNGGTITWSILSRVANVSRGVKGPRPELPDFRGQLHFSSVPTPFQRPYTTLRTQVKDFFPTVGHDISTTAENTLCPRQYTTNLRTLERGFDTFWQSVTFLHLMTEN